MKVLFVGYPKTGTKTIAEALRILGYKVYDFPEHFYYHGKEWTKILNGDGTKEDFQKMYADVDAAVDGVVFVYWKEILEAFPECKLVVNYRDDESWFKSVINQNKIVINNHFLKLYFTATPTGYRFGRYTRLMNCVVFGGTGCWFPWQSFQGINFALILKRYRQHNLQLQMEAPKDKLFAIDYKDGWTKLCKYLNKPVPDVSFPHKNIMGVVLEENMKTHPLFKQIKRELIIVFAIFVSLFAVMLFYLLQ